MGERILLVDEDNMPRSDLVSRLKREEAERFAKSVDVGDDEVEPRYHAIKPQVTGNRAQRRAAEARNRRKR